MLSGILSGEPNGMPRRIPLPPAGLTTSRGHCPRIRWSAMVHCFVSHTTSDHRDFSLAHKIAAELQARGVEVWIAPESIPAGDRWEAHIVSGVMDRCSHFLVILSAAAVNSKWVMKEVALARNRQSADAAFRVLP